MNIAVNVPASADMTAQLAAMRDRLSDLERENASLRIANAELERVVVRDTLTPLFNRRHFITCLNERIGRVDRYGLQSVVMFVDVDNMKGINDAYGHAAGDFALVHTANIIGSAIRSTDVAARIGGDEFALIIDQIDVDQAQHKMSALDKAIRDSVCRFGEVVLPITASMGCTHVDADDTEFKVIARADSAMYHHKRARRSAPGDQRSDR